MVRWVRVALAVSALAGCLATACTAYVAATLNGLDDYSQDGTITPGEQKPDACALVTDPDASMDCSNCITQGCGDEVQYACNPGGQAKQWFQTIQTCAQAPYEEFSPSITSFGWGCDVYDNPDAAKLPGTDDTAHQADSVVCIRDACLTGTAPPCKQCPVFLVDDATGQRTTLDDHPGCGQCLAQHCQALIVKCCRTDVVQQNVKYCADTRKQANFDACHAIVTLEAGANPGLSDTCLNDLANCYKTQCNGSCQLP
jgi:hypothetical protein